MTILNIW